MNTRSVSRRAAARWVVLVSAIVAVGCQPSAGFPPPVHEWSTPLPAGVDSDAATFRDKMATFPLSGTAHIRARAATCNPGTPRKPRYLCSVDVKIQPIGNTIAIDPDYGPPSGVAVARIENLDTLDTEALHGFLPGNQAVYVLWVDRNAHNKARWTIVEVPMGRGLVRAGYQKDLKRCHAGPETVPDADFYEYKHGDAPCDDGSMGLERLRIGEASFASMEQIAGLFRRVAAVFDRELLAARGEWISCSGGCCT